MTVEEPSVQPTKQVLAGATSALAVLIATVALATFATVALPANASAAVQWSSEAWQSPTNLPPGGRGMVRILVANKGTTNSSGSLSVSFTLPTGVTMGTPATNNNWSCTGVGAPQVVTCTGALVATQRSFARTDLFSQSSADINLVVGIVAGAPEGAFPLAVTVSGGGGANVTQTHQVRVDSDQLPFGPRLGSFTAGAFDQAGADYTQAGGHPYQATASFDLNTAFTDPSTADNVAMRRAILSQGNPKDIVVDLPPGFVGDPTSGPKCPDLGVIFAQKCPAVTQVGVATISPPLNLQGRQRMYGVYNVVPDKNAPAQFAFRSPIGTVLMTPVLRSDGDLGLSVHVKNITQADSIFSSSVTFWGVPADPSHDAQRCLLPNLFAGACVGFDEGAVNPSGSDNHQPHSSNAPLKPFLTNPTACSGQPVITTARFSPWEDPGRYELDGDPDLGDPRWVAAVASAPPVTGCDRLKFDPAIDATPTTTAPDSPTGLDFELRVPQNDDPNGLATAHLRDSAVVLPDGMTVNPSAADGLQACGSAQIGLVSKVPLRFSKLEPSCPLASMIGTVEVHTPLLEDPLSGDVFVAAQGDNPFDSLLAIYLVVRGPGLLVKLAGHVEADARTGRLTTTVLDNPQLPFDTLTVRLKGGSRAPLATPQSCGLTATTAAFTSWAGHDVDVSDSFAIDCPGSGGFAPSLAAGSTNPVGGGFAPFAVRIDRQDREQYLDGVSIDLPKGLLAKVKGVPLCANAQADAGTCGPESKIGTVVGGAGAGSTPFFTPPQNGSLYLTEGYKGAPYGLSAVVRAVAGPFDLGTVVVRQAIHVDRTDAHVTVVSDPLPKILEGIPLRIRSIKVVADRPNFMLNPSDCSAKQIKAGFVSVHGAHASAANHFEVANCAALRFKPRLRLALKGRRQVRTGKHPAIRAVVRQQGIGEAGIEKAVVRLPKSLALDPDNAQALCEFDDGTKPDIENHCPKGSIVGRARARTPLLNDDLVGNVYFVKNVRIDKDTGNEIRTLPMIIVALRGEIAVNLVGESSTTRSGKLVNTFDDVPDAPISRFNLNIRGGSNGILAVTRTRRSNINLCAKPRSHVAEADMDGQNGRRHDFNVRMKTPCSKRQARRAAAKRAANRR